MILVAGPWVGEFGWELFCWHGYIRKLSKQYDKTIVYSRAGHEYLYKDFAEFRIFNPKCTELNGFKCEGMKETFKLPEELNGCDWIDGSDFNIGFDFRGCEMDVKSGRFFEQEFIRSIHKRNEMEYDALLNIRNKGSDRDWPYEYWIELIQKLQGFKIATIGTMELSSGIEGVDDLRGITLDELARVMAKSKLLISPSSGAAHFASLCELPHLVWSSDFNLLKYKEYWNPFNTKCIFYSKEGWTPKPHSIYKLTTDYLEHGIN